MSIRKGIYIKTYNTFSLTLLILSSFFLSARSTKAQCSDFIGCVSLPRYELGGIDIDAYCKAQHGNWVEAYHVNNYGTNGWRCKAKGYTGQIVSVVDPDKVCRWQYGSLGSTRAGKWHPNPYSIRCYSNNRRAY